MTKRVRSEIPIDKCAYVLQGREDICRMLESDLIDLERKARAARDAVAALESGIVEAHRLIRSLRPNPAQLKEG